MEDLFSSNSASIIQKTVEADLIHSPLIENFDFYFDIEKIVEWIEKNDFKKVALEFPDELLNNSVKVTVRLKEKCPNRLFCILADTSYGSCCVDTVAAEHYECDSLVHFGHSCLSLVEKLPVFYVFEKFTLNLDLVETEVGKLIVNNKPNQKLVILYDVEYYYLYDSLCKKFESNPQIYITNITASNYHREKSNTASILFSRIMPDDLTKSSDSHLFFYIGRRESFLNPFLFYLNKNSFFNYKTAQTGNATISVEPILFSKTNRELMKRYYLIEKARDAKIFGILIGTMSVANYKEAIDHTGQLLKKAGRRFYSFLIGKLNCPKLNNFMEVDMYVLVACNENSLINSKELNKPIITIYELEMAFNATRMWGGEFVCDFRQLLPGQRHHVPLTLTEQESDVSLITGSARHFNKLEQLDANANIDDNKPTRSLINREDALHVMHYASAGEFLKNRSWTGLETSLGQTEVKMAVEGKKGIAAGYEDEPS